MQNRCHILSALVATLVFAVASSGSAVADDTEFMESPLAVLTVAGVERFEADLNRLSELSNNPTLSGTYLLLKTQLIQFPGIDYSQPIHGALWLRQSSFKDPAVVVFVPLSDGASLMKALQNKFASIEQVGKDRWEVQSRKRSFSFLLKRDTLLISNHSLVLSSVTDELLEQMEKAPGTDDLSASVFLAGLSRANRLSVMQGIKDELTKESQRQPNESGEEYRFRSQLMQFIGLVCRIVVTETQSVSAGINIESEINALVEWHAKPDSELAAQFGSLTVPQPALSMPQRYDVPFQAAFAIKLPEAVQTILFEGFQLARNQIKKEIGPKLAADDRGPVSEVFNSILETVQRGEFNGLVTFEESENSEMVLVAGLSIVRSDLVEQFLETVLPYARDSDDIKNVDLDFYNSETINLHRLQGRQQREEDRHLYGDGASLFVGTSAEAFWIANGGEQTPTVIQQLQEQKDIVRRDSLIRMKLSLDPWLRIAEKHQQDRKKILLIRQAIPDGTHDEMNFQLKRDTNKLSATLSLQQGYLKLLGVALKEEQSKKSRKK